MKYLMLIYDEEKNRARATDAENKKLYGEYMQFTENMKKGGNYLGGNPLKPTQTATTVRVRDGKRLTTDGPFAETKEQLGGYYLIEADSVDEALEWAAKIPSARYGSIEVRPVVQLPAEIPAG